MTKWRALAGVFLAIMTGLALADPGADLQSPLAAVRVQAARAMGQTGDRSAVAGLVKALKDPAGPVRREAAAALGAIKDRRAAGALVEALRDRDRNVRFQAAYALGEIKAADTAGPLLAALGDPEWCVRDQAAWALRELRDPAIVSKLVADMKEPGADMGHLVWLVRQLAGGKARVSLSGLLADPSAEIRRRGVWALVELKDPGAVESLTAALADPSPAIRLLACEGLCRIPAQEAEGRLAELVAGEKDPAVRAAAEKAILRLGHRGELLGHWSFDDGDLKIARDVTGHGNDGQIHGCAAAEGKVGRALRFGQGRYVELGRPAGLPMAGRPFTIMAWCKPEAESGVVVARGGAFCGFSLYLLQGVPKFGIRRDAREAASIAAAKQRVGGAWVHLAGVVLADRIELYVNGRLAASAKAGYMPGDCGQGMEIGFDAGNSAAEITDALEGLIDEVKMYGAALSEKDLARECGRK